MNERLHQQDFVDLLAVQYNLNKKDADKFVKEFFLLIVEALEKDKYVKIKGLGTFKLVDVESRESVKVNTGERFQIQGYTKISFTPDNSLRDIINKPFAHFETVVLNENTVLEDTPLGESDDEGEEVTENFVPSDIEDDINEEDNSQEIDLEREVDEERFPLEEKEGEIFVREKTVSVQLPQEMQEKRPDIVQDVDQPVEHKLSAEEIIARELESVPDVKVSVELPKKDIEIEPEKKIEKESKEKSPVPYLITIITIVLLLCAGALLFIYYPDIFDSTNGKQDIVVDSTMIRSTVAPAIVQDSIIERDTITESISSVKEDIAVEGKPKIQEEKIEAVRAASVPVKADSSGYVIKGTKTTYTIQEGETLTKVALRFYGTKTLWPYLVKYNPDIIKNPDNVPFGTTIKIPELIKK